MLFQYDKVILRARPAYIIQKSSGIWLIHSSETSMAGGSWPWISEIRPGQIKFRTLLHQVSLVISLYATVFVLPSVWILKGTICPKICSKALARLKCAKSLFPVDVRRSKTSLHKLPYSRFSHDVTKIQTKKLSILLSFWVSWGITAPKHLYLNKVLVPKGSSFCDRGRLNL